MGPNPTEPVNYRGSNTRGSKEIVDIEIAMPRNAGIIAVVTGIIAIGFVTIVATTLELLHKLTISEALRQQTKF